MHYDGTPVVDTKPVMFEVSMAGVGAASVPSPPVSVIPFNGIAEYELIPGPNIDRIRVRVGVDSFSCNLFCCFMFISV